MKKLNLKKRFSLNTVLIFLGLLSMLSQAQSMDDREDNYECLIRHPSQTQDHINTLRRIIEEEKRPIRILSLDGGGIRGILELIWLQELEKRVPNARIADYFDVFVGTSTGGIIAAGLASGFEIKKILDLYELHGDKIFYLDPANKGLIGEMTDQTKMVIRASGKEFREGYNRDQEGNWLMRNIFDPTVNFISTKTEEITVTIVHKIGYEYFRPMFNSLYSATGVERKLKEEFQSCRLSDLKKPLFVTATELCDNGSYSLHFFDSIAAQSRSEDDLKLWQALRATSAAPTFFPPITMLIDNENRTFVDGGPLANNPVYEGYARLNDYLQQITKKPECIKYNVLSLSTGQYYNGQAHAHGEGKIGWVKGIIDATMQGQSDTAHRTMQRLLKNRYYRLHTDQLTADTAMMDNVSKDNIEKLKKIALNTIREGKQKEEFNRICEFLNNTHAMPNAHEECVSYEDKVNIGLVSLKTGAISSVISEIIRDSVKYSAIRAGYNLHEANKYANYAATTATILKTGAIIYYAPLYGLSKVALPYIAGKVVSGGIDHYYGATSLESLQRGSAAAFLTSFVQDYFLGENTLLDHSIAFGAYWVGTTFGIQAYSGIKKVASGLYGLAPGRVASPTHVSLEPL